MGKSLFVIFALGLSLGLRAEGERMKVCKTDVETFCKGIEPGGGRIIKCLKEHSQELSADCKSRVSMAGNRGASTAEGETGGKGGKPQMPEACKADAEKFCKDAGPDNKRECMAKNREQFSPQCGIAIEERKAEKRGAMERMEQSQQKKEKK